MDQLRVKEEELDDCCRRAAKKGLLLTHASQDEKLLRFGAPTSVVAAPSLVLASCWEGSVKCEEGVVDEDEDDGTGISL